VVRRGSGPSAKETQSSGESILAIGGGRVLPCLVLHGRELSGRGDAIGLAKEQRGAGGELWKVEPRADPAGAKLSTVGCSSRRLEEGDSGEGTNKGSTRSSQWSGRCVPLG
jgi:hypothetical protein